MTTGEGNGRRRFTVGCGVLLLVFGAGGGFLGYHLTRGWTPWKVERLVNAACPPGTSRADVKAWLESNPFSEPEAVYYEELSGCIVKKIPDANVDLVCPGDITIHFHFDKQDKLVRAHVGVWICSF
jgi:hypothetical protein